MKKNILLIISLVVCFQTLGSPFSRQDTIELKQGLYNGIRWSNKYRNFDTHQFLFTDIFINGTVTMHSKSYDNLRLKYDIHEDEIITPLNRQDIIQLNKEMVDSFTIVWENHKYTFVNTRNDSAFNYTGYMLRLYEGASSLYIKHKKAFSPTSVPGKDGTFSESKVTYIRTGNKYYQLRGLKSFYNLITKEDKDKLSDYLRRNRIQISRKHPESFISLLKYYDNTK